MRGWHYVVLALGLGILATLVLLWSYGQPASQFGFPPPAPSPTATPQRLLPAVRAPFDTAAEEFLAILVTLAKLLAIPFVVWIVVVAIVTLVRAPTLVVVEELKDGTGEEVITGFLPALTEMAREQLDGHYKNLTLRSTKRTRDAPAPLEQAKAGALESLATELKDILPKWVQSLFVLVPALLPALNTHIRTRVVSIGDLPGDVGVISRMKAVGGYEVEVKIWEFDPPPGARPFVPRDKRKRSRDVVDLAMHWMAIELWERAAPEALKRGPTAP